MEQSKVLPLKETKLPAGDANGGFADCIAARPLSLLVSPPLLDAGATALNQDDQHENKKHAGSNPDDCRCVHYDSPFRVFGSIWVTWCEVLQTPQDLRWVVSYLTFVRRR